MDFSRVIKERYSVRKFKPDMICDDVAYKVMFTNKNLAKLFFDYISSHI